jgi:hypothetical protein
LQDTVHHEFGAISIDVNADKPRGAQEESGSQLLGCFQIFQDIRKSLFSTAENDSVIDINDEHSEFLYFPFTLMSEIYARASFTLG